MKGRAFLICLMCLVAGLSLSAAVVGAAQIQGSDAIDAPTPPILQIGLVTDENGVDGDIASNLCYQGLLKAESDFGVTGTLYTPTGSSEYDAVLKQCVDDGNVLCIASSWSLRESTANAAMDNPTVNFAAIDLVYDSYPDNLRGVIFAHDEAGYLAGVLAGHMTGSDIVGDLGGMPIPAVDEFVYGYRNGVQCANGPARVLIDYAWDFVSPALGAEMAQTMIKEGADVIFAPAGPTGAGAVLTATQSGVWGIGVDFDYYYTVFDSGAVSGTDRLLSSALKRFDNGVYETISDMVYGTFVSGTVRYGLEVDGVGLAPFHDTEPFVPQSVRDALEKTRLGIISGAIDLDDGCREIVFTPVILKP